MKVFAVGGEDNEIHIFEGFEKKVSLKGHQREVYDVAFLSDSFLASASGDETVKIWNYKTGECINELKGHTDSVYSLYFQPPFTLLSASEDKTLRIWNILNLSSKTIEFDQGVRQITSCDQIIYVLDQQNTIYLLDISPLKTQKMITFDFEVYSFTFLKGNQFALGAVSEVMIYEGNQHINTLRKHTLSIQNLCKFPSGELVSASGDGQVIIWDLISSKSKYTMKHSCSVDAIDVLCSDVLISGDYDGNVYIWNKEGILIEKCSVSDKMIYVVRAFTFQTLLNFQKIQVFNINFNFH